MTVYLTIFTANHESRLYSSMPVADAAAAQRLAAAACGVVAALNWTHTDGGYGRADIWFMRAASGVYSVFIASEAGAIAEYWRRNHHGNYVAAVRTLDGRVLLPQVGQRAVRDVQKTHRHHLAIIAKQRAAFAACKRPQKKEMAPGFRRESDGRLIYWGWSETNGAFPYF